MSNGLNAAKLVDEVDGQELELKVEDPPVQGKEPTEDRAESSAVLENVSSSSISYSTFKHFNVVIVIVNLLVYALLAIRYFYSMQMDPTPMGKMLKELRRRKKDRIPTTKRR